MKIQLFNSKEVHLGASSGESLLTRIQFAVADGGNSRALETPGYARCRLKKGGIQGKTRVADHVEFQVRIQPRSSGGLNLETSLFNGSGQPFNVSSASVRLFLSIGDPTQSVFFHPENIRYLRIKVPDDESYHREELFAVPTRAFHLGLSEDYALPVLIVLNRRKRQGMVMGASTENTFVKEFVLRPAQGGLDITILQNLRGLPYKTVSPGETLRFESLFFYQDGCSFETLLRTYRDELARNNQFVFNRSPLRRELIWGSWNMKIHLTQSEDLILSNAAYIKRHFLRVKWVQIDEGWAITRLWGESGYPDMDQNVDRTKFPHGMKYVADRIKEMGLKPAIWFSRMCKRNSRLFKEKPEWFALDTDGKPFLPTSENVTLDPSVPEVQEYLQGVFDTILKKWGFMGLKLDFFSDGFYARDIRYRIHGKSGAELLWDMFAEVRKRLPKNGYFLPGSMLSNANLFLGRYADIMRYAFDTDEIEKDPRLFFRLIQKSALLASLGSDSLLLGDSDAVGYFSYLEEKVEKSVALWCYLSGMMMEIGGDLPRADQRRLLDLKPLLDHPINGSTCRVLNPEFFQNNSSPIMILNERHRLLGIFNHLVKQSVRGCWDLRQIGSSAIRMKPLREFWSGNPAVPRKGILEYRLAPLESVGYRW